MGKMAYKDVNKCKVDMAKRGKKICDKYDMTKNYENEDACKNDLYGGPSGGAMVAIDIMHDCLIKSENNNLKEVTSGECSFPNMEKIMKARSDEVCQKYGVATGNSLCNDLQRKVAFDGVYQCLLKKPTDTLAEAINVCKGSRPAADTPAADTPATETPAATPETSTTATAPAAPAAPAPAAPARSASGISNNLIFILFVLIVLYFVYKR